MAFLHEHIILPLSDLLKGESVHKYLRLLREAEGWSDEQMHDFQQRRLAMLLQYSAEKVPFYRDWFHSQGLDPRTATLDHLPVVDKALMRREGIDRFAAEGFPEHERLVLHSSGSTGEPFVFYDTKLSYSVNMASKLRTWYQAGYRLGDKYMKISSSSRNSRLKRIQDWANRCSFEVYNSLNETSLSRILDNIERKKPLFIRSYPDPLYILAQYRIRNKCYTHRPNYIMTTASTLSDHQRNIIQDAFGCSIIDSYSCEGTPNTFQTPGNNTYHVCQYYGIIEVLDDNGDPVINGTGRVVSTDLWNFAQPFIRYDTKDIVEVYNGDIVHIAGRSSECVKLPDGALLSANNLTAFFNKKVDVITAYRLVFHQNGNVEVFVVPTNLFSDADKQEIINYWGHRLKTQVTVTLTESLSQRKNGKFQTIINETTD